MGVYVCRKCGKQFETNRITGGLCPECEVENQDKYHQVREYLWRHPGITANEIAKACDCSVKQVMKWVKEDRFMVSADSRVSLYCENCGTRILSGRYCPSCMSSVERQAKEEARNAKIRQHAENLHGTATEKPNQDSGHMRFL